MQVAAMPPGQQEQIFDGAEPIFRNVVSAISRMSAEERQDFIAAEYLYQGTAQKNVICIFMIQEPVRRIRSRSLTRTLTA